MTDEELYRLAYNAHERAETAALEAMRASLKGASLEALSCLCDPEWRWETRSWLSETIIEAADAVLNERLEVLVARAA